MEEKELIFEEVTLVPNEKIDENAIEELIGKGAQLVYRYDTVVNRYYKAKNPVIVIYENDVVVVQFTMVAQGYQTRRSHINATIEFFDNNGIRIHQWVIPAVGVYCTDDDHNLKQYRIKKAGIYENNAAVPKWLFSGGRFLGC